MRALASHYPVIPTHHCYIVTRAHIKKTLEPKHQSEILSWPSENDGLASYCKFILFTRQSILSSACLMKYELKAELCERSYLSWIFIESSRQTWTGQTHRRTLALLELMPEPKSIHVYISYLLLAGDFSSKFGGLVKICPSLDKIQIPHRQEYCSWYRQQDWWQRWWKLPCCWCFDCSSTYLSKEDIFWAQPLLLSELCHWQYSRYGWTVTTVSSFQDKPIFWVWHWKGCRDRREITWISDFWDNCPTICQGQLDAVHGSIIWLQILNARQGLCALSLWFVHDV